MLDKAEDQPDVAACPAGHHRVDPAAGADLPVLGTIFWGIATPTEGGAMGAVGALLLALVRGRLNYDVSVRRCWRNAASSFVMFILIGARCFR